MMNTILFKKLKADIKKNGMHDPILYIELPDGEKLVVDGHTRLKAAIELKLKTVPTKEITSKFENLDDIILWMIQQQFQRRNLSNVEKLQIAFRSKETIRKRANENLVKAGKNIGVDESIDTNTEIAKIAGVSRSTVGRYSSVLEKASKKLINEMHLGKISITAASKKTEKSPAKKATPATEKKQPKVNMFSSYEDGVRSLNNGEIKALVTVKDKNQIELFNSRQLEKVGFLLAEIQQHEPLTKRTKADYEELVAL